MDKLDPQAVALAKSIREVESKGNWNAKGGSGEWGAYQFMPDTWNQYARETGVNAPFGQATPDQQNEVAYKKIKAWKDQGYNPGQIASMWNAGPGRPNAYQENWKGVNSQGVAYDTPAYAEKVAQAYQLNKAQMQLGGPENAQQGVDKPVDNSMIGKSKRFAGELIKDITRPVATMLARPFQLAMASTGKTLEQQSNVPILSKIYGKIDPSVGVGDVVKDIGRGLQTASFGIGGGAALKGVQSFGKPGLLRTIAQGAKEGVQAGAVGGLGYGLEKEGTESTLGSLATNTAGGALLGGAAGGVLGGAAGILGKAKTTFAPSTKQATDKIVKEIETLRYNYPKVEETFSGLRNPDFVKKYLTESDLLPGSISKKGKINTGNARAKVQQAISPYEDVVTQAVVNEGKTINLRDVEQILISKIDQGDIRLGGIQKAMNEIQADIAGLARKADANGNIPLSEIQASKIYKYSNLDYSNPESKRAGKLIAQGFKEIVENNTDALDVKQINNEISKFYELDEVLASLNNKIVEGGRLGTYASQALGGMVGSHFGPLGTIVGSEVGAGLRGLTMASKFGRPTGRELTETAVLREAKQQAEQATKKVRVPVKSEASEFTNELPVIDYGQEAVSKFRKNDGLLPVAKGTPKVASPDMPEPYIPEDKLPVIDYGKSKKKGGLVEVMPDKKVMNHSEKSFLNNKGLLQAPNKKISTESGMITGKGLVGIASGGALLATAAETYRNSQDKKKVTPTKEIQAETETPKKVEEKKPEVLQTKNTEIKSKVPEEYVSTVKEATKEGVVSPNALVALINTENGMWDPEFVNPQGTDTGLGQHNDQTYEDINKLFKKKYGRSYDRKNAKDNILATSLWMNHLVDTYPYINNIYDVVAAYRVGAKGYKAYLEGKGTRVFSPEKLKSMVEDKQKSFKEFYENI